MKKLSLGLALLAATVVAPVAAQAQSISASATIASFITLGTPTNLAFGNLTPGASAATSTARGTVPVTHNVSFVTTIGTITAPTATNAPVATFKCGYNTTTPSSSATYAAPAYDVAVSGGSCVSGATITLTSGSVTTVQSAYLVFDGQITVQPNTVPGSYSWTIPFTVASN